MDRPSISQLAKICVADLLNENNVYLYGEALVKPAYSEATAMQSLQAITQAYLRYYQREKYSDLPEGVVKTVAEHIFATPRLPFKRVNAIVNVPFFRPDFSLVTKQGHDGATGIYYAPDENLVGVQFNANATKEDAQRSLHLLTELLHDFPFVEEVDKLTYLSGLLTLFVRSAIHEIIPSLCLDGNSQSVGKGLLCNIYSLIVFGLPCALNGVPTSKHEWSAMLDSILLAGTPLQVIDNIVGNFSNDHLAAVLTSRRHNVRIKGVTKVVNVPHNAFWIFNGNDMKVDSDMAERLMRCRLLHPDAASRKQDEFFIWRKYGLSIPALLRRDRIKYMQACLDIICAWVNVGCPKRTSGIQMAKYGEWESILGGIFDWLTGTDCFLSTHSKNTREVDGEKEETVTFLNAIMEAFDHTTQELTAHQITERIYGNGTLRGTVPEGLLDSKETTKKLGKWLSNVSTRKWPGVVVKKIAHGNTNGYKILVDLPNKR